MDDDRIILLTDSIDIYKIFDAFENLNKYVLCIVNENSDNEEYMNIPIFKSFDDVYNTYGTNHQIVVSDKYLDKLKEYNLDENSIIAFKVWFLNILKTKDIIHKPKDVRLDICTRCQLNCVGCYMRIDNNGEQGFGHITFEQFKRFIDENKYIKTLEISDSGEVFLNPDFVKIIEYAYNNGIVVTIGNGVNFNTVSPEAIEALVKYKVNVITFSIDGASDEVYPLYRRNGNYTTVINNIKLLLEYKKKYQSENPYMVWQYIIMEENECDIEKAKEEAKELGIDIYFKKDWRNNYKPKDPEKVLSLTGIDYNENVEYENKYSFLDCIQLFTNPQINWDGNIFGCCINYRFSWKLNAFEDGLINCLNSNYYRNALYRLLGDKEAQSNDDPCTKCYFFDINKHIYL